MQPSLHYISEFTIEQIEVLNPDESYAYEPVKPNIGFIKYAVDKGFRIDPGGTTPGTKWSSYFLIGREST
jgi:hypothetical protein